MHKVHIFVQHNFRSGGVIRTKWYCENCNAGQEWKGDHQEEAYTAMDAHEQETS